MPTAVYRCVVIFAAIVAMAVILPSQLEAFSAGRIDTFGLVVATAIAWSRIFFSLAIPVVFVLWLVGLAHRVVVSKR